MLRINSEISVDERELVLRYVRSPGPGGQNVNKVATTAQLYFDAANSPCLTDTVRERLRRLAGRRMTGKGVLIIEARRHRTRERNRQDAVDRLIDLLRQAAHRPKSRIKTRPSASARRRRMDTKRRRGDTKRLRGPVDDG
jgi:ribosome-associated protein